MFASTSIFFDLPDELCRELVAEWLRCNELVLLDSAVCSDQWRVQLLAVLPITKGRVSMDMGLQNLQWMNRRGIGVRELFLDDSDVAKTVEWTAALATHWKNITYLYLPHEFNRKFRALINTCTALTALTARETEIAPLKVNILLRLTYLQLHSGFSEEAVLVLKRLRKHCRLLRYLGYSFDPDSAAASQLIKLISLNVDLVSIKLEVDETMLQDLTLVCAHRLNSVVLSGNVDFNTMVYVLANFARIDIIDITKYGSSRGSVPTKVTYTKSKQSLSLESYCIAVSGWDNFMAQLSELRELKYYGFWGCGDVDESALKKVLDRNIGLTKLDYNLSSKAIKWSEVLSASNVIEELTIGGPNHYLLHILSVCSCLTRLYCTDCYIDQNDVPTLIASIRDYRHTTKGYPLVSSCTIRLGDEEAELYDLEYDGSQFSGSLWEQCLH